MGLQEVQHAARPTPAGAALGVAGDRPFLIEKTQGLLQHRLREPQLRMDIAEVMHQGRGIGIGLQQALKHPTNGQLQAEMLNSGTFKKGTNRAQAGACLQMAGSHWTKARRYPPASAISLQVSKEQDDLGIRGAVRDDGRHQRSSP